MTRERNAVRKTVDHPFQELNDRLCLGVIRKGVERPASRAIPVQRKVALIVPMERCSRKTAARFDHDTTLPRNSAYRQIGMAQPGHTSSLPDVPIERHIP